MNSARTFARTRAERGLRMHSAARARSGVLGRARARSGVLVEQLGLGARRRYITM